MDMIMEDGNLHGSESHTHPAPPADRPVTFVVPTLTEDPMVRCIPDASPRRPAAAIAAVLLALACHPQPSGSPHDGETAALSEGRLPTGARLTPAGRTTPVGQFPLAMVETPEGNRVVLLLDGYTDNGIQVVEPGTGAVVQTILQPASFLGLSFDHSGHRLFASGGDQDVIYRYDWQGGRAALRDSLVLAAKAPDHPGTRYPAGLALSDDDRFLYVAENLVDSLAVIDVAGGNIIQRLPAGRYPYAVTVGPDGTVFVSAWGGSEIRTFTPSIGWLQPGRTIPVARHPSAMLLNAAGTRLYVASASTDRVSVVDPATGRVIATLADSIPGGTGEGSTPNALALSRDERRLFVAEADNNAIAVFDLTPDGGRLAGRVPVGWYPTAVLTHHDTLLAINGKGAWSAPNGLNGPGPGRGRREGGYTLAQLTGTLTVVPLAGLDSSALGGLSAGVARANGWDQARPAGTYPPFEHVIYIIKENRTYDQVFGDLRQGDGDTSLTFFPRIVSPNHHALAERFGIFDRFLVNAEVSAQGHNWSTAAYSTDYTEKTTQLNYSGRGRTYDYEGENRNVRPAPGEDAAEPANGYLWDLARRRGITFRNYGEFVTGSALRDKDDLPAAYLGLKPFLEQHTDSVFPGFDLKIPDQRRAELWIGALEGFARQGAMPALQIIRLPNDHTSGAKAGAPTPRAFMADNDLALGRMIEALSRSRFWESTVVFVVEDDAQNGPDHVDSHRAPLLVISAWNRPRVWHRFANTTDVIATIEEILRLDHLSQFDAFGRPLRGIFAAAPDLTPYAALPAQVSMTERNPASGPGVRESERLDFRLEDQSDDDQFNRVLWLAIKGPARPYPGTMAISSPVPVSAPIRTHPRNR